MVRGNAKRSCWVQSEGSSSPLTAGSSPGPFYVRSPPQARCTDETDHLWSWQRPPLSSDWVKPKPSPALREASAIITMSSLDDTKIPKTNKMLFKQLKGSSGPWLIVYSHYLNAI